MAVTLQIYVCMSRLPINCCAEAAIFPGVTKMSKKGMEPSGLESSLVDLNVLSQRVYVIQKALFVSCFYDYKGVIHKSLPH